jgi:cytochrome P450
MIYTQATLMEILRVGNIVPIIPPRKVENEFSYKGYTIPKGMTIIPNLHSVFVDEKYWKDPKEFRPERFIGLDGQLCNTERFAPFGFGMK